MDHNEYLKVEDHGVWTPSLVYEVCVELGTLDKLEMST